MGVKELAIVLSVEKGQWQWKAIERTHTLTHVHILAKTVLQQQQKQQKQENQATTYGEKAATPSQGAKGSTRARERERERAIRIINYTLLLL